MRAVRYAVALFVTMVVLAIGFPAFVNASPVMHTDMVSGDPANVDRLYSTPAATPSPTPVPLFTSTVRSVWQADPQLDQQSGACTSVPINYCQQLVSLTPRGRYLTWKGQELKPYYLVRSRTNPNIYSYRGLNGLGDARITLTVQFTSATTFTATQQMTLFKEKTCTHKLVFSGSFLR